MQNESVVSLIIEVAHQVQGIFRAMYDSAESSQLGEFLVFGLVYFYVHYALVFLEKEWEVEAPSCITLLGSQRVTRGGDRISP